MARASTESQAAQRQTGTGGFGVATVSQYLDTRVSAVLESRRDLGLSLLDQADHPRGGLLDRELRRVDHRAPELALDGLRVLELLVDLEQLRVAVVRAAHAARAGLADLREPLRIGLQAHDLGRIAAEGRRR